jgi:hypothetical protein
MIAPGVLITSQHFVCAAHTLSGGVPPWTSLIFRGTDGSLNTATFSEMLTTSLSGTDIAIGKFTAPLPSVVTPAALPSYGGWCPWWYQLDIYPGPITYGIASNQYQQVYPIVPTNNPGDLYLWLTTMFNSNWSLDAVSGDSGHPIFVLCNNRLILVSHWTDGPEGDVAGSGPDYSDFLAGIISTVAPATITQLPSIAPGQPQDVSVDASSGNAVLTWSAPIAEITFATYLINKNSTPAYASVSSSTTTYTDPAAAQVGDTYTVQAKTAAGVLGPASSCPIVFAGPSNLAYTTTNVGGSAANLTWTDVGSAASSRVYKAGSYLAPGSGGTYSDSTGSAATYFVADVNASGDISLPSNSVTSAFITPGTISEESQTESSITITNSGPSGGTGSYMQNVYANSSLFASNVSMPYTLSGLSPDTAENIYVAVIDTNGNSGNTNTLNETTDPTLVPGTITDLAQTSTTIQIGISGTSGGSGSYTYDVYANVGLFASNVSMPYTMTGLSAGTLYDIHVVVTDTNGNTGSTNTITPTTDTTLAIGTLSITAETSTTLTASLSAGLSGGSGSGYTYSLAVTGRTTLTGLTGADFPFQIGGSGDTNGPLTSSTMYSGIQVGGTDSNGNTVSSNTTSGTTSGGGWTPSTPGNLVMALDWAAMRAANQLWIGLTGSGTNSVNNGDLIGSFLDTNSSTTGAADQDGSRGVLTDLGSGNWGVAFTKGVPGVGTGYTLTNPDVTGNVTISFRASDTSNSGGVRILNSGSLNGLIAIDRTDGYDVYINALVDAGPLATDGDPHTVTMIKPSSGNWALWLDGSSQTVNSVSNDFGLIALGNNGLVGESFDGILGPVFAYQTNLDSTNQADMESYMEDLYP